MRDGVDQMLRDVGWKKTAERREISIGQWEITGMMEM